MKYLLDRTSGNLWVLPGTYKLYQYKHSSDKNEKNTTIPMNWVGEGRDLSFKSGLTETFFYLECTAAENEAACGLIWKSYNSKSFFLGITQLSI